MSDAPSERRDLQGLIADMRVDVAAIKTRVEVQTGSLARLENKLDLGIFREEYERRDKLHESELAEVRKEVDTVRDDSLRREGAGRVWRFVFTASLAVLGAVEAFLHRQ